jgi:hypothetical protein
MVILGMLQIIGLQLFSIIHIPHQPEPMTYGKP